MKKILLTIIALGAVYMTSDARTVNGSVVCGKEKLSGVIVTDGTNFTQTARNGKFTFDIEDDAAFVYIVTPSGYVADWSSGVPAFYQKADKDEYVFELQKTEQSDIYNILAVGDPQPREEEHFEEFAGVPLEDLASTASSLEGVTVGIALGDICYDRLHLQVRWKEEIPRTGIPFYPAVGNHDHDWNGNDPADEDCAGNGGGKKRNCHGFGEYGYGTGVLCGKLPGNGYCPNGGGLRHEPPGQSY